MRKVELFLVLVSPGAMGHFLLSTALALAPVCPAQVPQHSVSQRHVLIPVPKNLCLALCWVMLIFLVQLVLGVIWVFSHSLEVFDLNLWSSSLPYTDVWSPSCPAMPVTCPCPSKQPPCHSLMMMMLLHPCPSAPPSPSLWPVSRVSDYQH